MPNPEENTARALISALAAVRIAANASGAGVHWKVHAVGPNERAIDASCFWYERATTGLKFGTPTPEPYEGPEYLIAFGDAESPVIDGRTREIAAASRAIERWLRGDPIDEIVIELPFVDAAPRAMRAIAARIDPAIERAVRDSFWAWRDDRACHASSRSDVVSCAFFVRQQQVAFAVDLGDAIEAGIHAWVRDGVSLAELRRRPPAIVIERHAEILEVDPARWHWLHVRDRIANPRDVLAPLKSLIEALAERPVITAFYTFSSMNRLCFSASSHFPWIHRGLPIVAPSADGAYSVDDARYDFTGAIQTIEERLGAHPIRPFFGSEPHHLAPLVAQALAQRGSNDRVRMHRRGAWFDLVVERGDRRVFVDGAGLRLVEGRTEAHVGYVALDDSIDALLRFLDRAVSIEGLRGDEKNVFFQQRTRASGDV